jgi:hypothetical protein
MEPEEPETPAPQDGCEAMSPADRAALARAVTLLERTSLAATIAHALGKPAARLGALAPASARLLIERAATLALERAAKAAARSLPPSPGPARARLHAALSAACGAAGGALGLTPAGLGALAVELPVSTLVILRAIADVARAEGEDPQAEATAMACLEVFALGGRSETDNEMDSAYFALRGLLAKAMRDSARHLAAHGLAREGAPALLRLAGLIAPRFGAHVARKVAAQSLPLIGALGGAAINYAFARHFEDLARGHFTVRRLERAYGAQPVAQAYARLAAAARAR